MVRHSRRESFFDMVGFEVCPDTDLLWPFGKLDGLDRDEIRETAYEIFFAACRSSPGFGGRNALTFYSKHNGGDHQGDGIGGGGGSPNGSGFGSLGRKEVVTTPTSRVKRALGLKMLKRSPSRRMSTVGTVVGAVSAPSSPGNNGSIGSGSGHFSPGAGFFTVPPSRPRRPLTSAEIMRQQMKVTEQSDTRLRKTLMRTLVGQTGRRAETIILPLELLRHVKSSEFGDVHEYQIWQRRQLKVLEAGLLIHPSIPLEKTNNSAMRLREIIRQSETKAIDTSKNSDIMPTLCNIVSSLSWRNSNPTTDVCHWADGYPLNIHLYVALLQSIFDVRDETLVLDEIDELLELMKKTWLMLGITRPMHNLCFTWVLFHQYIVTSQMEPDLLGASHAMLAEVANDAKKSDREALYVKLLTSTLASMQGWTEKRLLSYHDYFQRGNVGLIENLLPLALSSSKILGEDVTISQGNGLDKGDVKLVDSSGDRVDYYIRASLKNAFSKVIENMKAEIAETEEGEEAATMLLRLAKETEELALRESECFSPILKRWYLVAAGVASVSLHQCYGSILMQYLAGRSTITKETVEVLQTAGKLEKVLVQMVAEDSEECEDGGKGLVREMVPYEIDSIILRLLRQWIDEKLQTVQECLSRAKEAETWNPKSKSEPYAQSAGELMKLANDAIQEFFEIPIGITEDLVHDLADGLEKLFQEYTTFVASCGSKQSYIPTLPPLTRCNRDSKFVKLWKKATPCTASGEELNQIGEATGGNHPRPSTSRGTQRLYVRLNTLHFLSSQLHSLNKSLSLNPRVLPATRKRCRERTKSSSYFEFTQAGIESACQHVSEVAAYRLIFLDSYSVFYESLYTGDVANARIKPGLRILKHNLTLMTAILADRAQALAMKEVMKASFEVVLTVLLAGGHSRVFYRTDHDFIEEDFESLKKVYCTCGEGLIPEEVVDREAETVEGVIQLMGQPTEQLMEDFSIVTCESSGMGLVGTGQKLPMPPTTGRWNRSDPNTILRVLCYRDDRVANQFLKKSFQLGKRR
ncbi:unnamed protein product [Arabidopsis lyrata]|uniref:MHD1 domain-containing protein n=1 Tax=Arabidopsis lyrata subsp. lyrata TaxID=81972 RepID=D7KDF2_ARALL|nr:uncharacterized protein LOC9325573 [Arabidopsis lyrata subsp. lyrata]EFH68478.1 hypothetical protein ARALYDRAFT_470425 [Arabidopsis lyrata subsp. lyrata]CAH8251139.1 unnamed protein product [Arabidopsis lyrata]|eukprot:XP_002892219.1 uncharacterized protein LOC9325573 [Arabidopsis lyrata subsp. lyrata]